VFCEQLYLQYKERGNVQEEGRCTREDSKDFAGWKPFTGCGLFCVHLLICSYLDSKMAPTTLADMLAHEPFNAGRELINAGKFEMAIEHFSSLLETTKEESGELSEVRLGDVSK